MDACDHLALAVPGKDFVRRCIDAAQAHRQWQDLCDLVRKEQSCITGWSPDRADFTWLETAFCDAFLKHLRWYGGIDHEWRTGERLDKGSFYVLLWSRSPRGLWWELFEQVERHLNALVEGRSTLLTPGSELLSYDSRQMSFGDRAAL